MRHQLRAQSPKLDSILPVCPPSPRFARSLPQGRAEEGRREVRRERERRREAEQAGRLPAASLVLPGAGRGGEGRLARPGSSRLAGWPTGWGYWRGGCAAWTIAGWRSQTPAFLRCSREPRVEVGRGGQEAAERVTHRSCKCRGGRGGESGIRLGEKGPAEVFQKL